MSGDDGASFCTSSVFYCASADHRRWWRLTPEVAGHDEVMDPVFRDGATGWWLVEPAVLPMSIGRMSVDRPV